jgi:adenine-specific DNA-methyltransferase
MQNKMLNILNEVDLLRIRANSELNPKRKTSFGQFFTPGPTCRFMASLFKHMKDEILLLDPGCGTGSLLSAFIEEALHRNKFKKIHIETYDIENKIKPFLEEVIDLSKQKVDKKGLLFSNQHHQIDFILHIVDLLKNPLLENNTSQFSHIIMNPPYKKIANESPYRKALHKINIETVNLYTGFVALAIKILKPNGELVAIVPRSFCNGPYYKPFRDILLNETSIHHIHIFDSRKKAFSDDEVLQENIIFHCIKNNNQNDVTITSSPAADFHMDDETNTISAVDMTTRTVPFDHIVNPIDKQRFIHIAANDSDQLIIDRLSVFNSTLEDLSINVATGPVVDFRLKKDLRRNIEPGAVPLLYPIHLDGSVHWPKDTKKPNAIAISDKSRSWLWEHSGCFVLTRRFTAKEEKRRIVASLYNSKLPGELIGFENKLNVFHSNKKGFDETLAKGLFVFLNSTLLDRFYRLFGGHTQVNATDIRAFRYPSKESLCRIGLKLTNTNIEQKEIDHLLEEEINRMNGEKGENPLSAQRKLEEALQILIDLGMPRAQQNERSALTLLALLNLQRDGSWQEIERPMMGVTPIMDWCRDIYGKGYAPNTRETFRRQTLHQFIAGGLCLYNPDNPKRPVNSPKACYQITPELHFLLSSYKTGRWENNLQIYLKERKTLVQQYAMDREMNKVEIDIPDNVKIKLSPGAHSQLIKDIIIEFGQRFAPGSKLIYIGDTGAKEEFFDKEYLAKLGVTIDRKGKFPDVVLYSKEKEWLLLIESVTSHGPMDGKRHGELSKLFENAKPGIVYVTAFPDRRTMAKHLADISWETDVWVADAPTHLIHFNGDKFLGPYC